MAHGWRMWILMLALGWGQAGPLKAQDPGDIPLQVFDENGPKSPMAEAMQPFVEYSEELRRTPPRVRLDPVLGPSNGLFPMGWIDGIDDPSGPLYISSRQSLTNMGTLAYAQHLQRERRRERSMRRMRPRGVSTRPLPWTPGPSAQVAPGSYGGYR
jgi:hypothetical protein